MKLIAIAAIAATIAAPIAVAQSQPTAYERFSSSRTASKFNAEPREFNRPDPRSQRSKGPVVRHGDMEEEELQMVRRRPATPSQEMPEEEDWGYQGYQLDGPARHVR